jgi:hypothetical protein
MRKPYFGAAAVAVAAAGQEPHAGSGSALRPAIKATTAGSEIGRAHV